MTQQAQPTHYYAFGGANESIDSRIISTSGYEMACNVELRDGILGTRSGIRNIPIFGTNNDVVEFSQGNGQGFSFHNPSKGQSTKVFGDDKSLIMCAVAGKKYYIELIGDSGNTQALLTELQSDHIANRQLHLVWWESAETYALANDGNSNLWIWDTENEPFQSNGYVPALTEIPVDPPTDPPTTEPDPIKETSELPNGGTVILYVHNRIAIVVNGRFLIYGDIVHKTNRYSPENLLKATEQVHWATGVSIIPPSNMGPLIAGAILPLKDTAHGHGAGIYSAIEGGQFSVQSNLALREEWANTPMVHVTDISKGATGPYAQDGISGDLIFRSSRGIDSLRSASAEHELEGNQENGVGGSINGLLSKDVHELLRFCSLKIWEKKQKILCTIDHKVRGRWRYARAMVMKNLDPVGYQASIPVWEGLVTLPNENRNIVQMVKGDWAGKERLFAITREDDMLDDPGTGINRLVEFDKDLKHDVVSGTAKKDIDCWVRTRKMTFDQPFIDKEAEFGKVFFNNVDTYESDRFKFCVMIRSSGCDEWTLWRAGNVCTKRQDLDFLRKGLNVHVALGKVPKGHERSLWFQLLVKWKGYAEFDSVMLTADVGQIKNELTFKESKLTSTPSIHPPICNHHDYEYSFADGPDWHKYTEDL